MPKPKHPALNRAREHRIEQEIVVDAYASDEREMSWLMSVVGQFHDAHSAPACGRQVGLFVPTPDA